MSIKRILKDTCILASLMILSVFAVSIIWSGLTEEISLVFKLFGLAFMISLANLLFDEYVQLPIIPAYIVKYFLISGIVMLYGFIAGWFYPRNFWMAFIYVAIVLIAAYSIDSFRIKQDVEYINRRIHDLSGSD